MSKEVTVSLLGCPIRVEITYYSPKKEAYISGAPEDCYPEEPAEVEWDYPQDIDQFIPTVIRTFDSLQDVIERQLIELLENKEIDYDPD